MHDAAIKTYPLTHDRLADFLAFFDGDAFSDNPAWSSCYCQCFYEDHAKVEWSARTAAQNRACASARITDGVMGGYLAYREGHVVGWCNAAARPLLRALDAEPIPDAGETGTILCFLVAPAHRGQGVARALLNAACDAFSQQGFRYAEANPRPHATTSAENHFGPLGMYLAAGFSVRSTDADGSVWVRKVLA